MIDFGIWMLSRQHDWWVVEIEWFNLGVKVSAMTYRAWLQRPFPDLCPLRIHLQAGQAYSYRTCSIIFSSDRLWLIDVLMIVYRHLMMVSSTSDLGFQSPPEILNICSAEEVYSSWTQPSLVWFCLQLVGYSGGERSVSRICALDS